jgi:hypothetical protein
MRHLGDGNFNFQGLFSKLLNVLRECVNEEDNDYCQTAGRTGICLPTSCIVYHTSDPHHVALMLIIILESPTQALGAP